MHAIPAFFFGGEIVSFLSCSVVGALPSCTDDPAEKNNLAAKPHVAERLKKFRQVLTQKRADAAARKEFCTQRSEAAEQLIEKSFTERGIDSKAQVSRWKQRRIAAINRYHETDLLSCSLPGQFFCAPRS